MMTDPIRQIAQPMRPNGPNSSFKNIAAKTALQSVTLPSHKYPINTLRAPSGVTKIAGAKVYAAKLAASPMTTAASAPTRPENDTCYHASPPYWILHISIVIS